jgi:hypothetical protein
VDCAPVSGRYGGALALLGDGRALEAGGGYLECDNEGGCWFIYVTAAEGVRGASGLGDSQEPPLEPVFPRGTG